MTAHPILTESGLRKRKAENILTDFARLTECPRIEGQKMLRLLIFLFAVLIPLVIVGISNLTVFPDAAWLATLMLVVTGGIAGVLTWKSGDATPKIRRYCIVADFGVAVILCINVGCHWILSREVSAARQGVTERHIEEDRDIQRKTQETNLEIARREAGAREAEANARLQNAERRRLAQLPVSERRSLISAPSAPKAATAPGLIAPMSLVPPGSAVAATPPRLTPDQVRDAWWWRLTVLAFAECFAGVLGGIILGGVWEWDRNHDGIPDHLQAGVKPGK